MELKTKIIGDWDGEPITRKETVAEVLANELSKNDRSQLKLGYDTSEYTITKEEEYVCKLCEGFGYTENEDGNRRRCKECADTGEGHYSQDKE